MADKAITELVEASQVTAGDLFVLQQDNTAKKLSGQTLINYLLKMIDGHGGITSYEKVSTSGLKDTYRFTLADESQWDIVVTNGRAITSIKQTGTSGLTRTYTIAFNDNSSETFAVTDGRSIVGFAKTGTAGLVDTYTITYNDGTKGTLTVTNGAKGDKGDNVYLWIKYASQEPTDESHSMSDLPDNWIGIYAGTLSGPPVDWEMYTWFKIKGEQGDKGDPATVVSNKTDYQVGISGSIIPSGSWQDNVPVVPQGQYLWTRTVTQFNTGDPATAYSVARFGIDGTGSVSSVANISPDENGNVSLKASDIGALPETGGDLLGELRMNGQPISGLNPPTEDDQAANKGYVDAAKRETTDYVDAAKKEANDYTNEQVRKAAPWNLLDNPDFRNPVNQRGQTRYGGNGYSLDRWNGNANIDSVTVNDGYITVAGKSGVHGFFRQYFDKVSYLVGKTLTAAVYTLDGAVSVGCAVVPSDISDGENVELIKENNFVVFVGITGNRCVYQVRLNNGASLGIKMLALYEGEYTLDTLPEYQTKKRGAELSVCLIYYHLYATEEARPSNGFDCSPPMRINAVTQGAIEIDGVTYYYNAADL